MASPNSTRASQQKGGEKKRRQQQLSPAKRRRDRREEKNSKICEPKRKRSRVANDLVQPKTESGDISPELYSYLRKEVVAMVNELRNSVLMTLQRVHLEMKNLFQDDFRTVHLQRPDSEDECVSICTSLSSIE